MKKILGYIVDHSEGGVMYQVVGRRSELYCGGRKVTIFPTRTAAKHAIIETVASRQHWIRTKVSATQVQHDKFSDSHWYTIRRAVAQ